MVSHDTLMAMWRPPPPGPRIGGGMWSVPAVLNHSTAMACTATLPHGVSCAGTARHAHGDVSAAATRTAHRGRDGAAHSFSGKGPAWTFHKRRSFACYPPSLEYRRLGILNRLDLPQANSKSVALPPAWICHRRGFLVP